MMQEKEMQVYLLTGVVPRYYQAGYLCIKDGQALAIDAAFAMDELESVLQSTHSTLQAVLLTHAHYDHCASAAEIRRRYGVKIYASPLSQPMLDNGYWLPGYDNVKADWQVDQTVEDGHMLHVAGFAIMPYAMPGHTMDSTIYIVDGRTMFAGDVLLPPGYGRCDFPTGDVNAMRQTAQKLLQLDSSLALMPGHRALLHPAPRPAKVLYTLQSALDNNPILQL